MSNRHLSKLVKTGKRVNVDTSKIKPVQWIWVQQLEVERVLSVLQDVLTSEPYETEEKRQAALQVLAYLHHLVEADYSIEKFIRRGLASPQAIRATDYNKFRIVFPTDTISELIKLV